MDIKCTMYNVWISKGKVTSSLFLGVRGLVFAELVKVKDLAEISQQSICCSYKPYCRGIIKRGQCL